MTKTNNPFGEIKVYEDEFIKIVHKESKPKTNVYDVVSKCRNLTIGEIKWDTGWRHYVWQDPLIKLSDRYLLSLGLFVMEKNIKHKGKNDFVTQFVKFLDEKLGKNWDGKKYNIKIKDKIL